MTLSPALEKALHAALVQGKTGLELQLEAGLQQRFFEALENGVDYCFREGFQRTALLVDPRIRMLLRRLIEKRFPRVAVLSYAEVAPGFIVNNLLSLEV